MNKVLLCFSLLLYSLFATALDFGGGTGTKDDPYIVSTKDHLFKITNDFGLWDKHYIQTADIVFNEDHTKEDWSPDRSGNTFYKGFIPIGRFRRPFKGSYNGNGFVIRNIYICTPFNNHESGLFSEIWGVGNTVLRNIHLVNAKVDVFNLRSNTVGGIVGKAYSAVVENCTFQGVIEGGTYIGGVVGSLKGDKQGEEVTRSILRNCGADVKIKTARFGCGGLVGKSRYALITDCYARGEVWGEDHIGGFIGSGTLSTIKNCYTTANVYTNDDDDSFGGLGGFAASGYETDYINCYCAGKVARKISTTISELSASVKIHMFPDYKVTTTNCIYDKEVCNINKTKEEIGLSTSDLKTATKLLKYNFGIRKLNDGVLSVWDHDASYNNSYPYLAWEKNEKFVNVNEVIYKEDDFSVIDLKNAIYGYKTSEITEYGLLYSDQDISLNLNYGHAKKIVGTGLSESNFFNIKMTGLKVSSKYWLRAYIVTSGGAYYSKRLKINSLKKKQTITLDESKFGTHQYGDILDLDIKSSSGLPVAITLRDEGFAEIVDGTTLKLLQYTESLDFTLSQPGNDEYAPAEDVVIKNFKIRIRYRRLTAKPKDAERYFGEAEPEFLMEYEGFAPGENEVNLKIKPVMRTNASPHSSPGDYEIYADKFYVTNYYVKHKKGTLKIKDLPAIEFEKPAFEYTENINTIKLKSQFKGTIMGLKKFGVLLGTPDQDLKVDNYGLKRATAASKDEENRFENQIEHLEINKEYSFCTFATNNQGNTYYSKKVTFRTQKKKQTISFDKSQIENLVYGDEKELVISSTSGLPVQLKTQNNNIVAFNNKKMTVKGAGSVTLTFTQPGNKTYEKAEIYFRVHTSKKELTITADNKVKVEGEDNPVFTLSYSGFINGQNPGHLLKLPTISCDANKDSKPGDYDIVLSGGSAEDYKYVLVNGKLTVNKAPILLELNQPTVEFQEDADKALAKCSFASTDLRRLKEYGIVYGLKGRELKIDNSNVIKVVGSGVTASIRSFNCMMNHLSPNVEYSVCAYGVNETGTFYSTTYTFKSNKLSQKIVFDKSQIENLVYGDEKELVISSTSGLPVQLKTQNNYIVAFNDKNMTVKGAGSVTLTFTQPGNETYEKAEIYFRVHTGKKELTITADNKVRFEGEDNPAFTLSYSGFINGQNPGHLLKLPTISCDANKDSKPGDYDIVLSGGNAEDYKYVLVNGKLTVAPIQLELNQPTVEFQEDADKVLAKCSFKSTDLRRLKEYGIVYGLKGRELKIDNSNVIKVVGSGVTASIRSFNCMMNHLSPNAEYSVCAYGINKTGTFYSTTHTFKSNKLSQKIVFDKSQIENLVYGDELNMKVSLSSGLTYNITSEDNTIELMGTKLKALKAGNATIKLSQSGNDDYLPVEKIVNFTISKKDLTITAIDVERNRGDKNPTLEMGFNGFVNSDDKSVLDVLPSISCSADENSELGDYPIVLAGGNDDNYNLILNNGILKVSESKQSQMFNFDESQLANLKYGDELNMKVSLSSGLSYNITSDDNTIELIGANLKAVKAGKATIKFSQSGNDDYLAIQKTVSFTIAKKDLTITANNSERRKGEANQKFEMNFDGFINGDDKSDLDELPLISCSADENSDLGDYPIVLAGGNDDNYNLILNNGTLKVIEQKQAQTFNFDESQLANLKYGDELNMKISLSSNLTYSIASKDNTIEIKGTHLKVVKSGNATIKFAQPGNDEYFPTEKIISFTIAKKDLTVTAKNVERNRGDANPTLEMSFNGFVNSDDKSVLDELPSISCSADENSDLGDYPIVLFGGNDDNYSFIFKNGTLKVNESSKQAQSISFDESQLSNVTYGDEINLTATASSGLEINITSEDNSVELSGNTLKAVKAGNATIKISQSGNDEYLPVEKTLSISIAKKELAITVNNYKKTKGDANPDFEMTFSGFVNGDDKSVLNELPTISCSADENSDSGDYAIIMEGGNDDNYRYEFVNSVLTVEPVTSVKFLDDLKLKLYPNPCTNYVVVEGVNKAFLEICDLTGKKIYSERIEKNDTKVELNSMPSGVYIIRLISDSESITRKIIKK